MSPTVVICANRAFAISNSRVAIIERLIERNWHVIVAAAPDETVPDLLRSGAEFESVEFHRGISPVSDLTAVARLSVLYRRRQPDLVQNFNAKPVFFSTLAARLVTRAQVVNTITGLGHAFIEGGVVRLLASGGYRLFGRQSDRAVFQNQDDLDLFTSKRWVDPERARLIVSSGIDTERFRPIPNPGESGATRVLMIGRLIWQKGVREFVAMAEVLRERFPDAKFQLAGEWDEVHPDAVPRSFIEKAAAEGTIEFLGFRPDLDTLLPRTTVFVLPSYREGTPRVLLEAAACGVPVVAFDVPGCRAAVRHNRTGFLTAPHSVDGLVDAVETLLKDSKMRRRFGEQARRFVSENFDSRQVTESYLDIYRELGISV